MMWDARRRAGDTARRSDDGKEPTGRALSPVLALGSNSITLPKPCKSRSLLPVESMAPTAEMSGRSHGAQTVGRPGDAGFAGCELRTVSAFLPNSCLNPPGRDPRPCCTWSATRPVRCKAWARGLAFGDRGVRGVAFACPAHRSAGICHIAQLRHGPSSWRLMMASKNASKPRDSYHQPTVMRLGMC